MGIWGLDFWRPVWNGIFLTSKVDRGRLSGLTVDTEIACLGWVDRVSASRL